MLPDTLARGRALVTNGEAMAAWLRAMGWTERRPGVFGVGPDLEEDDDSEAATGERSGVATCAERGE